MCWLFGLSGILTVLTVVLTIKICLMKKSAGEIKEKLEEKLKTDTNTLIDISSADRDMRSLAASLNVQLKELQKERQRFCQGDLELKDAVANISHDLRTPLTAICGYLDLLECEETNERVRQYLAQIADRTDVMKQLTKELFDYSLVSSVKQMTMERLCLNSVLEESIASFYGVIVQRGIEPLVDITDVRVERMLDRSALVRVFGNIIGNAVKYSDGDLSVKMDGDGVITFSNKAEKLDAVEVGRLFDRFYTVEAARHSAGLGLSIAKQLTRQMGGEITAEYENGRLVIIVKL